MPPSTTRPIPLLAVLRFVRCLDARPDAVLPRASASVNNAATRSFTVTKKRSRLGPLYFVNFPSRHYRVLVLMIPVLGIVLTPLQDPLL